MRFSGPVAPAVGAIAPAAAFWMTIEDRASPGGDIAAVFTLEDSPFGRQQPSIEAAMEGAASERAQPRQVVGVNIDLALSVVLLVEQVDQFPCGTAVKITAGANMQVAVVFLEFYMKVAAHTKASINKLAVTVHRALLPVMDMCTPQKSLS
jgi:hypothetical protein